MRHRPCTLTLMYLVLLVLRATTCTGVSSAAATGGVIGMTNCVLFTWAEHHIYSFKCGFVMWLWWLWPSHYTVMISIMQCLRASCQIYLYKDALCNSKALLTTYVNKQQIPKSRSALFWCLRYVALVATKFLNCLREVARIVIIRRLSL